MTKTSDVQLQNTLDAVTNALQNGDQHDMEAMLADSAIDQNAQNEIQDLVAIIQSLHLALTPVQPRPAFADKLQDDLLERRGMVMVSRVRQVPPRLRLAALLALIAGFLLLVWRRLLGSDSEGKIQEEVIPTSA